MLKNFQLLFQSWVKKKSCVTVYRFPASKQYIFHNNELKILWNFKPATDKNIMEVNVVVFFIVLPRAKNTDTIIIL